MAPHSGAALGWVWPVVATPERKHSGLGRLWGASTAGPPNGSSFDSGKTSQPTELTWLHHCGLLRSHAETFASQERHQEFFFQVIAWFSIDDSSVVVYSNDSPPHAHGVGCYSQ